MDLFAVQCVLKELKVPQRLNYREVQLFGGNMSVSRSQ